MLNRFWSIADNQWAYDIEDEDSGETGTVFEFELDLLSLTSSIIPSSGQEQSPIDEEEAFRKRRDDMMRQKFSIKNPFVQAQIHMNLPVLDQPFYGPDDHSGGPGLLEAFAPGDIVQIVGESPKQYHNRGEISDYQQASVMLKGRSSKKIGNNTYLVDRGTEISIRYHNTDIITYRQDGTCMINTDGWWTVTTLQRINRFSPAQIGTAYRSQRLPYPISRGDRVAHTLYGMYPYEDGVVVDTDGIPVDMEKVPMAHERIGEQAEIIYKDKKRSRSWRGDYWKVMFSDGEVGYYAQDTLKIVKPVSSRERLQHMDPTPEIQSDDDIIVAIRNPFITAQELKNDTFSEETERPSDVESDTGHNLEFVDRSDNKKNNRPTHHQGPVRSAQSDDPYFDQFFDSYIGTAIWSGTDDDGNNLDENFDGKPGEFEPATYKFLQDDAKRFYDKYEKYFDDMTSAQTEQAGHDFWLTRNGHGAGFWDGGWPEPAATEMTNASKAAGEINLMIGDDGLLYAPQAPSSATPTPTKDQISDQIWDLTRQREYDPEQLQALLDQWKSLTGTDQPRFLGGSTNTFRLAQTGHDFNVGDVVQFDSPSSHEELYGFVIGIEDSSGEPFYVVQSTDGQKHTVRGDMMRLHGSAIEPPAPAPEDLEDWYKKSRRNPFVTAQNQPMSKAEELQNILDHGEGFLLRGVIFDFSNPEDVQAIIKYALGEDGYNCFGPERHYVARIAKELLAELQQGQPKQAQYKDSRRNKLPVDKKEQFRVGAFETPHWPQDQPPKFPPSGVVIDKSGNKGEIINQRVLLDGVAIDHYEWGDEGKATYEYIVEFKDGTASDWLSEDEISGIDIAKYNEGGGKQITPWTPPTHYATRNPFKSAQSVLPSVGDTVDVGEPTEEDSTHSKPFRGTVVRVTPIHGGAIVDVEDQAGDVYRSINLEDIETIYEDEEVETIDEIMPSSHQTPIEEEEAFKRRRDDLMRKMFSSKNPFKRAQTDQETAENGHLGNSESKEGPNRGGRTPGSLDNPTPNNPFAHETSENSKGEQVA